MEIGQSNEFRMKSAVRRVTTTALAVRGRFVRVPFDEISVVNDNVFTRRPARFPDVTTACSETRSITVVIFYERRTDAKCFDEIRRRVVNICFEN